MIKNITIVRGDDTNFLNNVLLVVSFKTILNLDGYKLKLTVENPTNIIKQYEVQQNTVQIDFNKIDSSTFSIGEHRANLKLIDTLGKIKTIYLFTITVQNEFEANIPNVNEYEIEIELDTEGISKYKNYEYLINKPSINGIELIGDIKLQDISYEAISSAIKSHNDNTNSHQDIRSEINIKANKSDVYNREEIDTWLNKKQDNILFSEPFLLEPLNNELSLKIDNQTIQINKDGELVSNMDELGNEVNNISSRLSLVESDYITNELLESKGYITNYIETDPLYIMDKPILALKTDIPQIISYNNQEYSSLDIDVFIGKNTLENIKNDYIKRGLTENNIVLTEEEKTSIQSWLGIDVLIGDIEVQLQKI